MLYGKIYHCEKQITNELIEICMFMWYSITKKNLCNGFMNVNLRMIIKLCNVNSGEKYNSNCQSNLLIIFLLIYALFHNSLIGVYFYYYLKYFFQK